MGEKYNNRWSTMKTEQGEQPIKAKAPTRLDIESLCVWARLSKTLPDGCHLTAHWVEAHAELIAQAPTLKAQRDELLAALGDCVESLERCIDNPKLSGSPAYRVTCIQQARAAIAACKASGKDGGK